MTVYIHLLPLGLAPAEGTPPHCSLGTTARKGEHAAKAAQRAAPFPLIVLFSPIAISTNARSCTHLDDSFPDLDDRRVSAPSRR